MTLYEFRMLSDDQQLKTVWDKGVFLDNAITSEHRVNLYAINMFYIEIYYDVNTNKIDGLATFKHGERMNKYSGNIQTPL